MDLSKIINREVYHFMGEDNLHEDYPESFDIEHFKTLNSFAARKRYADEKLPKIASGTGRRVYAIDDDTVLKLAMNNKGLAQNKRESELSRVNWYEYITEVKDEHFNQLWIESERAKRLSPRRFQELTGYSLEEVGKWAREREHESVGRGDYHGMKLDPKVAERMWEDPFTYQIAGMIGDYGQAGGDLDRISTYGEVNRDGKPEVVILDYGLSQDVWKTHYDPRRKTQRYPAYRMGEGNPNYDDELTNFVDADDVKDGGYAFTAPLPTKELEGDDLVKEDLNDEFGNVTNSMIRNAVDYVENIESLKDVSRVYRSYMVSARNIEKALEMAMDGNKFYNNLMAIQNKLKGFGLVKEDLVYWHADDANPNSDEFKIGAEINEDGSSLYMTSHGVVEPGDVDMEIQESEEKQPEKQKVGTLMVKFEMPSWDFILDKIKDVDLYHPEEKQYGKEDEPHITVLYGFNETVLPEDIQAEIGDFELPIKAKIKGISLFNNPEFDVIKLDVESPDLVELRRKVETLPNTLTYTDYKPHMTIAYAIRGRGQKYVYEFKNPIEIQSSSIVFSDSERNQIELDFSPEIVDINEGIITKAQLAEYVKNYMNESNILSLKDLPFKDDIERLGGKIFSVGGAVRDEFLGKDSKDLDILITGIPMDKIESIASRYGRVDAVGESFGVLKFVPTGSNDDVDIAIPRTEKKTGEGHQGFEVTSDHTLPIDQDLIRRDFTINAIAKDVEGNVIDPYGGVEDLKNKIIKVVNPKAFGDDPLRMLRAVQFASRFDFEIEPMTMNLIQKNANKIKEIAFERVLIEFDKIVKKGNALIGVELLRETGLFKALFGKNIDINRALPWDKVHTMGDFIFLMLKDISDKPSEIFKDRLKGDIDTYKEIKGLEIGFNQMTDDDIKNRVVIHNMYSVSPASVNSGILPRGLEPAINDVIRGSYPKNLKELAVNGNDLMNLGLQGKEIGDTLKSMLVQVYIDKVPNNKEDLLATIQNNDVIGEAYEMIENMLSEREIRYMPNAVTVDVNKNCRLGGNADGTSDACNQGEMKNLTTNKIEEDEEEVNSKRPYYLKDKEPVKVNESNNVKWGDSQIEKLEKVWKNVDDNTKESLKNVYFNVINNRELPPKHSAIMNGLIEKHGGEKKENPDIVDISKKLKYYSGLWRNIGDPAKRGTMTSLYNKAQKEGELSKREYDELDYFLKNGRTRYNAGDLSKKYK